MKQSIGRPFSARPSALLLALSVAAAGAVGLAACGGGDDNSTCHYIAQAANVIGQTSFKSNASGLTDNIVGSVQGAAALYAPDDDPTKAVLLVADTANNRILGYNGIPSTLGAAANFVIGQDGDFTSSTPSTSATGLNHPSKVWFDATGQYLVVADSGNNRVLIWTVTQPLTAAPTSTPAVVGQTSLTSGQANPGGTISLSSMDTPTSAIIAGGKLIVADKNNSRVLIWNTIPAAGTTGTPADVVLGQTDNSGTTGSGASVDAFNNATQTYTVRFSQPSDIWSDGSELLITDTANSRVLYYSSIPTVWTQAPSNVLGAISTSGSPLGQTATATGGTNGFNTPWGVTSNGSDVFVGDTNNNRVLVFKSYLTSPSNAKDADYVYGQADFTHILGNDPDQNGKAGDQRNDPNTNGVTAGTLHNPQGVTASAALNDVFISDTSNSRLMVDTITSTTSSGQTNYTAVDGSNPHDSDHCF